jgi:hypothetical protein
MKSETRNPKSEKERKGLNRAGSAFGLRASDFFRISAFGFRI